jgi:hypothetical protein
MSLWQLLPAGAEDDEQSSGGASALYRATPVAVQRPRLGREAQSIDGQTGRHGPSLARPGPSSARPARPGYEPCRALMGRRAAAAAQARPVGLLVVPGRPGGTIAYLSIL